MKERLSKLRAWMKEEGCDLFFITSTENIFYISGFHGSAGAVLVSRDFARLYADSRYREQAMGEAKGFEILPISELSSALEAASGRIAFEEKRMTVGEYHRFSEKSAARWVEGSACLEELRLVKDRAELDKMRQAAKIADEAFSELLSELRPGMTELQAASRLEFLMRAKGASKTSFETIVVSGNRSSLPHGKPTEKVISCGELVTFDFGCVFGGYCSDMTRTIAVGEISGEMERVYETVRLAQETAAKAIKPGMTGREADRMARDIIEKAGFGEAFGHGTGHGVGIEIHERPTLSQKGEEVLRAGMIVTVEPGIYLPGKFGVRIEDMGVITASGFEPFSKFPKTLIRI